MKERLKMAENEREELRAAKENEEVLTRQIKQLSKQLVEAKKHHTPVRPHTHTHTHTPVCTHTHTHTHTHRGVH